MFPSLRLFFWLGDFLYVEIVDASFLKLPHEFLFSQLAYNKARNYTRRLKLHSLVATVVKDSGMKKITLCRFLLAHLD